MVMKNIFEGVQFISGTPSNTHHPVPDIKVNAIYAEGTYIKNCEFAITEEMIEECGHNPDLIAQAAILEGAKIDWALKNWLKEGQDYKGLKAEVNKIVEANNMDKEALQSKGKGFMHVCKRILQIWYDLAIPSAVGTTAAQTVGLAAVGAPGAIVASTAIGGILGLITGFIINRLIRYLVDTVEFNTIKKDAQNIVTELRANARKAEDKKIADKMNKEADRLEDAIIKYIKDKK